MAITRAQAFQEQYLQSLKERDIPIPIKSEYGSDTFYIYVYRDEDRHRRMYTWPPRIVHPKITAGIRQVKHGKNTYISTLPKPILEDAHT